MCDMWETLGVKVSSEVSLLGNLESVMLPEIEIRLTVVKISMMCRFPSSSSVLIGRIHPDISITVSEEECVSYSKKDGISFQVPCLKEAVYFHIGRAWGKHRGGSFHIIWHEDFIFHFPPFLAMDESGVLIP